MTTGDSIALALFVAAALAGCSKSGSPGEQERTAKAAEMQQAVANSLAEEREKDRQMREAAATEASEEVARVAGGSGEERRAEVSAAQPQVAVGTQVAPISSPTESAERLRAYTERLRQSVSDPAAMQLRNAIVAPNQNGMCAEFSARDKAGTYSGFKRVIVTDSAVNPEEPPDKETFNLFTAFQTAARDTGCFADVLNVRVGR